MLVAILGVLQAGGGYVPMDPKYPFARVASILETCGAGVVVTTEDLVEAENLQGHGGGVQLLAVPAVVLSGPGVPTAGVAAGFVSGNLAYILFTSGSTGRPKGVELSHEAVLTCVYEMLRIHSIGVPGIRYLQTTTYTFDVSVPEIFVPLVSGGCVVLTKQTALLDMDYLRDVIRMERPTSWSLVPTALSTYLTVHTI
jgi:non-ribosomal peptide synthetase component F